MTDRFIAIRAQLENINNAADENEAKLFAAYNRCLNALREIAAIKPDDHGNGLRLAIATAERALDGPEL